MYLSVHLYHVAGLNCLCDAVKSGRSLPAASWDLLNSSGSEVLVVRGLLSSKYRNPGGGFHFSRRVLLQAGSGAFTAAGP